MIRYLFNVIFNHIYNGCFPISQSVLRTFALPYSRTRRLEYFDQLYKKFRHRIHIFPTVKYSHSHECDLYDIDIQEHPTYHCIYNLHTLPTYFSKVIEHTQNTSYKYSLRILRPNDLKPEDYDFFKYVEHPTKRGYVIEKYQDICEHLSLLFVMYHVIQIHKHVDTIVILYSDTLHKYHIDSDGLSKCLEIFSKSNYNVCYIKEIYNPETNNEHLFPLSSNTTLSNDTLPFMYKRPFLEKVFPYLFDTMKYNKILNKDACIVEWNLSPDYVNV